MQHIAAAGIGLDPSDGTATRSPKPPGSRLIKPVPGRRRSCRGGRAQGWICNAPCNRLPPDGRPVTSRTRAAGRAGRGSRSAAGAVRAGPAGLHRGADPARRRRHPRPALPRGRDSPGDADPRRHPRRRRRRRAGDRGRRRRRRRRRARGPAGGVADRLAGGLLARRVGLLQVLRPGALAEPPGGARQPAAGDPAAAARRQALHEVRATGDPARRRERDRRPLHLRGLDDRLRRQPPDLVLQLHGDDGRRLGDGAVPQRDLLPAARRLSLPRRRRGRLPQPPARRARERGRRQALRDLLRQAGRPQQGAPGPLPHLPRLARRQLARELRLRVRRRDARLQRQGPQEVARRSSTASARAPRRSPGACAKKRWSRPLPIRGWWDHRSVHPRILRTVEIPPIPVSPEGRRERDLHNARRQPGSPRTGNETRPPRGASRVVYG